MKAVDEIGKASKQVQGKKDIARVAAVSSNDDAIGDEIAKAMESVSHDGVITVEESQTMGTELEIVEGMQFDRGHISAYMVTDTTKMTVLDDPIS